MDHQGEFTLQVMKKLGAEWAEKTDWSGPRLLCIAGDFTRYDEYAVLQIPRNIELLRYRRYGGDLLLLELVHAGTVVPTPRRSHAGETVKEKQPAAGATNTGADLKTLQDVWESLRAFLLALGDDVADEGAGAIRRVPAAEELRLCQAAQKRSAGVDKTRSFLRTAGSGIHARRQPNRSRRDRGSGNPDTDRGRFGTRPAASAAQLSGRLIRVLSLRQSQASEV